MGKNHLEMVDPRAQAYPVDERSLLWPPPKIGELSWANINMVTMVYDT